MNNKYYIQAVTWLKKEKKINVDKATMLAEFAEYSLNEARISGDEKLCVWRSVCAKDNTRCYCKQNENK